MICVTDLEDGCLSMSYWSYGRGNPFGLWERLRHIWHIIKYGHPFLDDITLDRERALALGQNLFRIAGNTEEKS